ncbi:MAG: hypothetical protein J6A29_06010 [Clostridia bacterium]|nr:hypothetical protein [Clostridia bacterium]
MIVTKQGIMKKCIEVNEITNQKYFLRKEGKYLTVYKKTKNGVEVLIEVLITKNCRITPDQFWGIVEKEAKGEKIYISTEELKKLDNKEQVYKDN